MSNKVRISFIVLICALVLVFVGVLYKYRKMSVAPTTQISTIRNLLKQENTDFNLGDVYRNQNDFSRALDSYTKALKNAKDFSQEGQIKYDIALMTEFSSKHADAISQFKAVAANTNYTALIRAYSVQEMGEMYHKYYDDTTITSELFKDQPYVLLKNGVSDSVAYRKLFEYAASIYPLGLAESYVAFGYGQDLANINNATTTEKGILDITMIKQALLKANEDTQRMSSSPSEIGSLAGTYSREAIIMGFLIRIGVPGYSVSDTESLHKKAIQQNASVGGVLGSFITYHYAVFLAKDVNPARISDLKNLLSVFSGTDTKKVDPKVSTFFKVLLSDSSQKVDKQNTALLGNLDPDFKTYLVTLGWNESDFKTK